ncbi:hypothetical protein TSOC_004699 [Tetrabaena socialis]|uniref:Uncharacterized protein n=1 Tax=Tetrabaena socialis TaxID=47790 RepID=A0A2J8A888_9CHLO|nr:hypothetical protein TSOC_004699 [Tetrabaena socialis]|eukprot:PNH08731.1 hypothetical protein TSOC_004699 [Tetrabaena socialis]
MSLLLPLLMLLAPLARPPLFARAFPVASQPSAAAAASPATHLRLDDVLSASALASSISSGHNAEPSAPGEAPDPQPTLLSLLADVVSTPGRTQLRRVHELQQGGAGDFLHGLLEDYPALDEGNLAAWASDASGFLAGYAAGMWPLAGAPAGRRVNVSLTALSGLPVVRRVLMAQLATAWLTTLGRRLPREVEPQLALLVKLLYDIHRASVVQRGVMEYLHISKSGGTSWNVASQMNGCVTPDGSRARLVPGFDDTCRWMHRRVYKELMGPGPTHVSARYRRVGRNTKYIGCQQRYEQVVSRGLSFYSNEYTLQNPGREVYDTHLCPQVVNVVTLREPLRRMESAVKFLMIEAKERFLARDGGDKGHESFGAAFCNISGAHLSKLAPPICDNYIVR